MKKVFIFLSNFLFISSIFHKNFSSHVKENYDSYDDDDNDNRRLRCNSDLLRTYNLVGYKFSKKKKMIFCPNIRHNCCNMYDMIKIKNYYDFFSKKVIENNKNRFINIVDNFFDLYYYISNLNDDYLKINKFNKKYQYCFEVKSHLKNFDLNKIRKKMINKFKNTLLNFSDLHKSFYCVICDAKSLKYIDFYDRKIYVTQNFCKKFIFKYKEYFKLKYIVLVSYINLLNENLNCYIRNYRHGKTSNITKLNKLLTYKYYFDYCFNGDLKNIMHLCKYICDLYQIGQLSYSLEKDNHIFEEIYVLIIEKLRYNGFTLRGLSVYNGNFNLRNNYKYKNKNWYNVKLYFGKKKFLHKYMNRNNEARRNSIYDGPFEKLSISNYFSKVYSNNNYDFGLDFIEINNNSNFDISMESLFRYFKLKYNKVIKKDIRSMIKYDTLNNYLKNNSTNIRGFNTIINMDSEHDFHSILTHGINKLKDSQKDEVNTNYKKYSRDLEMYFTIINIIYFIFLFIFIYLKLY